MTTKYAENARKAQKAYYNRQKQIKLDKTISQTLYDILKISTEESQKQWPETIKLLEGIRNDRGI